MVEAQQQNDQALFRQAIDHYTWVVQRYEASQDGTYRENVRELATTSYMGLGAAYQRQGDLERAKSYYQQCMENTTTAKTRQRCAELIKVIDGSG